jgi:signal transduction histidine kinase
MSKELKILMLEDVAEEAEMIERVLRKDKMPFVALRVDGPDDFTAALESFTPDVVISDHALPQFNSIEALKLCRSLGFDIPFILVTGAMSEEFAVNALKQGVDDYILKSNLSRLPSAIAGALSQRDLASRKLETELKLRDQNEELVRANGLLRKINGELDNFVYSISHNLRAPLMSVLGLVSLAKHKSNEERDSPELIDMIERSVRRLDDTLKEILDYSRNARTDTSFEEVDVRAIFDDALERLQYLPGFDRVEKQITIRNHVPFFSDPYRLSVIFQNLVSNSIKYQSHEKKSFMKLDCSITGKEANIVFADNGIGIRHEYLPRIFDMFFRATEQAEGAGLGLYIVKESISKLKGQIEIESELNAGATFRIRLPNGTAS